MNQFEFNSLLARVKRLPSRSLGPRLEHELRLLGLTQDKYLADLVRLRVDDIEAQSFECPFLEPGPASGLDRGDIHVLNTSKGQQVRVSFDEHGPNVLTHMLIGGQTNTGKSCFLANLLSKASRTCFTFVIDATRSYRKVPEMYRTHQFLRWNHLRLNVYDEPDGVPYHQVDQVMNHQLCQSYGLQFAELEISEAVSVLRKSGTPNFPQLLAVLKQANTGRFNRRQDYRNSAILVLQNLLNATGDLFRCRKGMNSGELFTHNICLEIDGLLPAHQAFLVRALIAYLQLLAQ